MFVCVFAYVHVGVSVYVRVCSCFVRACFNHVEAFAIVGSDIMLRWLCVYMTCGAHTSVSLCAA